MATFDDFKNKRFRNAGRLSELLEKRQKRLETPSLEEARILDYMKSEERRLEQQLADLQSKPHLRESEIRRAISRIDSLKRRVDIARERFTRAETARQRGAESMFQKGLSTALAESTIETDISQYQRGTSTLIGAISGARKRTTFDIEAEMLRKRRLLSRQAARVKEASMDLSTPEQVAGFELKARTYQKLLQETAQERATLAMQKRLGLDIESRFHAARPVAERAIRSIQEQQLTKAVISGQAGKRADVEERLQNVTAKLVDTFKEFEKALDSGAENVTDIADKFEELSKQQDQYQRILRLMSRYGEGGGGRIERMAGALQFGGRAFTAAGDTAYVATVASRIRKENIRNMLGTISNQQYEDVFAATQGDMRALRRLMNAQYEQEFESGMGIRAAASRAAGLRAVGAGAGLAGEALAGAMKGAAGGAGLGAKGAIIGGVGGGIGGGLGNLATTTALGIEYTEQLLAAQDQAIRMQQLREQDRIRNAIRDRTTQRAFTLYEQMGLATRGTGTGRGATLNALQSGQFIEQMAELGISADMLPALTGMGQAALGVEFRGANAANLMRSAGRMVQGGYMASYQDVIKAQGQLAGVGGNLRDLEDIIATAVQTGMDSSKNIDELVNLNARIAERSAQFGVSTVGGAGDVIRTLMQSMQEANVPTQMRSGIAQRAAAAATRLSTSTDVTFGNMIEFARLRESFPDASLLELTTLAKLSPADINELQRNPEAAEKFGLRRIFGKYGDAIRDIRKAARVGLQQNILPQVASPELTALMNKQEAGQLTPEEERRLEQLQRQAAFTTGVPYETYKALNAPKPGLSPEEVLNRPIPTEEVIQRQKARGISKEVLAGQRNIEEVGGLTSLVNYMGTVADKLDPTKFSDAVDKSMDAFTAVSEQFGTQFTTFKTAVDQFQDAVNNLVNRLSSPDTHPMSDNEVDKYFNRNRMMIGPKF